jgi:hypothetical protein
MLGVEMIGVLPIGVDLGTPNKYEESFLGSSEIAAIDSKQIILTSTDFPELILNDSATHNTVKTNVALLSSEIAATESYYKVFGYINENVGIEIAATDFHNLLLYILDPAQLAVFSDVSGGASQSLQQFSSGDLLLNSQNAESFYTLRLQEFDNNPTRLEIGGTTGEMLVIAGGGGGPTEIPQIWIG